MTYRRTWFSFVLWFLFTALCIIVLTIDGVVCIQNLTGLTGTPLLIAGLSLIPAAVCLYCIIRGITVRIRKKYVWNKRTIRIAACIFFLLVLILGLVFRIVRLNGFMRHIGEPDIISSQSMEYYDRAVVTEQSSISPTDYGINDLYVMLLSSVLSFLGNKVTSAVYLQIFLQIMGLLLVYTITRQLARRLPACIAVLYFACSLCCLNMITVFGPEWLYFVIYLLVMLIASCFVKNYCADNIPRLWAILCAVVVGALIGMLSYLDLSGISLLVVMLIAAVGKKTELEATVYNNYSKGMNAALIACSFVSCAVVWHRAMSAAAYMKGSRANADVLDRLWTYYWYSDLATNMQPYFLDVYLVGLLIVPATFLIFEFFRSGKEQNYMPWIILCLVAAPTPMTMSGEHGFVVLSFYIWAVLAGLGLQNCILGGRDKVKQTVTGESIAAQEVSETEKKPNYIENPLPLPKKHVAKEMDYQYEVAAKDMKYDLFVSDNDDYDIK